MGTGRYFVTRGWDEVRPLKCENCRALLDEVEKLREVVKTLESIMECLHQPNPQDKSRWDIAKGQHKAFSAALIRLRDALDAHKEKP